MLKRVQRIWIHFHKQQHIPYVTEEYTSHVEENDLVVESKGIGGGVFSFRDFIEVPNGYLTLPNPYRSQLSGCGETILVEYAGEVEFFEKIIEAWKYASIDIQLVALPDGSRLNGKHFQNLCHKKVADFSLSDLTHMRLINKLRGELLELVDYHINLKEENNAYNI